jgi:hypothetical protein
MEFIGITKIARLAKLIGLINCMVGQIHCMNGQILWYMGSILSPKQNIDLLAKLTPIQNGGVDNISF